MKIAIDALGIHYFGGGRSATLNLLEALFALDPVNQYTVLLTQPEPSLVTSAKNVRQWIAPFKQRFLLRLWAQAVLPFALRTYDLVHYMKNLGVFFTPAKTIVTVFDMTTLRYPELFPRTDVWYWKYVEKHTLRQADRVIAISQDGAKDIEHFYQIPQGKISVIYPAHATHFQPASAVAQKRVREKYHLPDPYILHVGRIDRKKNLPLLLEAFALFRQENLAFAGKLVFVGEEYRKSRDTRLPILIEQLALRAHVMFTGPVSDSDLPAIYSAATVSVFCSLHEGFGIVALEALACGAPLIVTPAGAVEEVVQDAAIVVNPPAPAGLAVEIARVVTTPGLREELIRKGLARAQSFSYAKAASHTLKLYEEVIQC